MSAPFVHEFRVRWGECDPQGIVFNSNYVAYFDDTIGALWRQAFGSYAAMTERGLDMVVAEINLQYRASAKPEEMLRVEARIERLGETSLTTLMSVMREDELLVEGRIRHVFVDNASWKKTPIPDWLREGLSPYLDV
ncbi:MAG: acyl-CoA thioester hydrolase [Solirubrobacterales bacterium]|jgi:acyl-CoA thioester hydrolase|nr:acyl-CoA thioester hydrolase [Solirubrobacterales bacterium]